MNMTKAYEEDYILDDINLKCDILIAGGGISGVSAAIAAARNGANVILCQDRPVLGGNASSEIRMHIVGADGSGKRGVALETEAREGGIIEEIRLDTAVRNPQRSASMLDLILYDKCRENENINLLLNTTIVEARTDNGKIKKVIAERQSTEDVFHIHADIYIDCTGDGRLGKESGAHYRWGRESKDTFDEDLAVEISDNQRQGSTLLFQAKNVGYPTPFQAPKWARHFTEEDLKLRPHASKGTDRGLEYGYWWVEWGGTIDTIKDNEIIRDELLAIMLGVWDHIKNHGDHGAENWALDWFGFVPGKRESRRFIGMYTLTENDLLESKPFHDKIAFGGWPIDLHPPEGIDAPEIKPTYGKQVPFLYDIPLRSCISENIDNLMFAGRNISASHVAFASTRVMATCSVIGQGVGTAAAYTTKNKLDLKLLSDDRKALQHIQQNLLRDDAYLIDITNEDKNDIVKQATITCSSEQDIGQVTNILTGQTRSTHGEKGVVSGRSILGTNRWMSEPDKGFPAWIEFEWEKSFVPSEVQIVFDTGLHRVLTLSHSDGYVEKMQWGKPQPETVKNYSIEYWHDDNWKTLATNSNNYQRLCRHTFSNSLNIKRLRLNIHETHGIDHARICEVRIYTSKD